MRKAERNIAILTDNTSFITCKEKENGDNPGHH